MESTIGCRQLVVTGLIASVFLILVIASATFYFGYIEKYNKSVEVLNKNIEIAKKQIENELLINKVNFNSNMFSKDFQKLLTVDQIIKKSVENLNNNNTPKNLDDDPVNPFVKETKPYSANPESGVVCLSKKDDKTITLTAYDDKLKPIQSLDFNIAVK
jgi:hypothetical protein